MNRKTLFLIVATFVFFTISGLTAQKKISFTFDDGTINDRPGYTFQEWNALLLKKLWEADVRAMLFVAGKGKNNTKGSHLLHSWNAAGHGIANHTWSHHNYSDQSETYVSFRDDILKADTLLRPYSNFKRFFRYPYLKEGETAKKVDSLRSFLRGQGYKNGYVTIDASDWYIDTRLIRRLKADAGTDLSPYRDYYLHHIWERAQFYEDLSYKLNGRHISHTLLLHHNLLAALFIDDLISFFREKGWEIVSAEDAFKDPIYSKTPKYAGESLIYALAKDTGKFEHLLRYPPDDSRYEKDAMDALGL